jgi:hypothetical protein
VPWTVTVRRGGRIERVRLPELTAALELVETRAAELARTAPRRSVDVRIRRFDPGEQVYARIELAGPERLLPRVRGGVDIRGDGSSEPYLGRVRRTVLERDRGESAAAALRRTLGR